MESLERLQKVIAQSGVTSRRKAEVLITEGKVTVNGEVVNTLGTKVRPSDKIEVEGIPLENPEKLYFILYKPTKVITSVSDEHNRPVVTDFFEGVEERLFPVGRLDYDTSGLLLMTNDGEFANLMTHPRYKVKKKYIAKLDGYILREEVKQLERGVKLEDGLTAPAQVKVLSQDREKNTSRVEITISEGRNRQVRRMFSHLGHEVVKLSRVEYGPLTLKGLNAGEARELTPHEVKTLRNMALHRK